ncbi:hypothetical protein HJC23_009862 [Cyclotella cryptica]|uniref:Band 7 domain-containing protein n=1 Tax=Cyclotella cryptica TaxID=29204 RepID=A0ABD3QAS0_9STRA|eukprot:CCRYP_006966-RA/>CCRYP_006966-RA protein AED:0.03 eAED:0.03 QI:176/1/1/1/0.66/0.5/4/839/524
MQGTSTLSSIDIRSVGEANAVFGSDTSVMVARIRNPCCRFPVFWFTVPEGFYALVTRHGAHEPYTDGNGKKNPVWPSGLHLGSPWLKVSHLVTKQLMMFNTEIKGCKTKDNVTVLIDISILLRVMGDNPEERPGDDPQNVFKFVHEVTPIGLQAQLKDAQAEAVRTLARSVYHTEVFGLRNICHSELEGVQEKLFSTEALDTRLVTSQDTKDQEQKDTEGEHDCYDSLEAHFNVEAGASVTEAMRVRLNRQFNKQGIEIIDVIIKDIKLPETIQSQMSQKTMVISQNAMQRMQQKHDMLRLIQEEEIKTLNQTHTEQRKELLEDGKFKCLMEDIKLQTVHAEGDRQVKSIETQMCIDVELVQVESNLTVKRIQDETRLETERIREQSKADSEIELAKAKAEVDMILANGELDVAKIAAKGDKAIFEAEGIAAPLNCKLNDHTTELLRLKAQYALATNDQLVVTGTEGGRAASTLLQANSVFSDVAILDNDQKSRNSMLAHLAVASGAGDVRLIVGDSFLNKIHF